MSRGIEFDEWFLPKKDSHKITCGIELEFPLFDIERKQLLRDYGVIESVLQHLPDKIWRDYYAYQLELRTDPHDNPRAIVEEAKELYRLSNKEFCKRNIYIVPAPGITNDGGNADHMYCGMHSHIGYPKEKDKSKYFNRAMGMYPFLLSLVGHTKNFETSQYSGSDRLRRSNHIGLPYLTKNEFLGGNDGNNKYKDIILSNKISKSDSEGMGRSRMVKPDTIEFRMLDTPSLFNHFEFQIYFITHLASRIRDDNPMVRMLEASYAGSKGHLQMTRDLLINQRYGVNKIFRMLNSSVCEDIAEYFDISYPRQTQFEFREEKGYSGDINGYLSMISDGGWI